MVEEKNWLEMTSEGSNYTLEDEGTENYRTGGYRAVRIRDTFSQSKPGWGHLSAVWLAWDTLRSVLTPLSLSVWISHSCWLKTLEKLEIWEWMLSTQQSVEGQLTNFVEWNKKNALSLFDFFFNDWGNPTGSGRSSLWITSACRQNIGALDSLKAVLSFFLSFFKPWTCQKLVYFLGLVSLNFSSTFFSVTKSGSCTLSIIVQ